MMSSYKNIIEFIVRKCLRLLSTIKSETSITKKAYFTDDVGAPPDQSFLQNPNGKILQCGTYLRQYFWKESLQAVDGLRHLSNSTTVRVISAARSALAHWALD